MAEFFRARVNSTYEFDLSETSLSDMDQIRTGPDAYHILKDNRSVHITVESSDFFNARYTIRIEGETFEVDLDTPLDLFIEKMGFAVAGDNAVDKVAAPMPGLLLSIYVTEGQEVEKDTPLLVLEAMKMENVILSPRKGIIDSIMVSQGTSVEKGTVLISFR
ncbi:biotin/lipoyl-containing protein [Robertkochia flava]|uniref:biotin/lipoyl-containing protein n=1 Tax=Robertkochia flava TaxID=3447986 RepID=UPI001CC9E5D8|nr:biotin/lipoyl-containing protein [Robertkochia marina]